MPTDEMQKATMHEPLQGFGFIDYVSVSKKQLSGNKPAEIITPAIPSYQNQSRAPAVAIELVCKRVQVRQGEKVRTPATKALDCPDTLRTLVSQVPPAAENPWVVFSLL